MSSTNRISRQEGGGSEEPLTMGLLDLDLPTGNIFGSPPLALTSPTLASGTASAPVLLSADGMGPQEGQSQGALYSALYQRAHGHQQQQSPTTMRMQMLDGGFTPSPLSAPLPFAQGSGSVMLPPMAATSPRLQGGAMLRSPGMLQCSPRLWSLAMNHHSYQSQQQLPNQHQQQYTAALGATTMSPRTLAGGGKGRRRSHERDRRPSTPAFSSPSSGMSLNSPTPPSPKVVKLPVRPQKTKMSGVFGRRHSAPMVLPCQLLDLATNTLGPQPGCPDTLVEQPLTGTRNLAAGLGSPRAQSLDAPMFSVLRGQGITIDATPWLADFAAHRASFLRDFGRLSLDNVTVLELKQILRRYGLSRIGKKTELEDRVKRVASFLEEQIEKEKDIVRKSPNMFDKMIARTPGSELL